MRFFVDAQLPPALCAWLDARGHRAEHAHLIDLGAASDAEIARHVEAQSAILMTKDSDFLVLRQPDRFVVVWLRCGNTTNIALSLWLAPRWAQIERLLAAGEGLVEVR